MNEHDFQKHYTEDGFWQKLARYALVIGREGIKSALILYYTLQDPEGKVPAWAKAVVIGALGYFIFPLDVIPDFIPAVGFTDDLAVLVAAMGTIALNIPQQARDRAEAKMKELFGLKAPDPQGLLR